MVGGGRARRERSQWLHEVGAGDRTIRKLMNGEEERVVMEKGSRGRREEGGGGGRVGGGNDNICIVWFRKV